MTTDMKKLELKLELLRTLSRERCESAVPQFLERIGLERSEVLVLAVGGWTSFLLTLVPDPYPTIDDLVKAIKKAGNEER